MAVKIELKRSAVPGKIPTTSSLELGEVAINTYDGKLFYKQDVTGSESIVEVATVSGSILSASYALYASNAGNAVSSSYALNATTSSYALVATSASYAQNSTSASYAFNATSASYANDATSASYAQTASYANDFTVAGTLTAQKLVVQTISSSIIYSSGSNIFGDELSDIQQFTGSVDITGSLTVNGKNYLNDSASFDSRILANSSSIDLLSGSYLNSSASFDTRILNNSSSIGLLSSSFLAFSGSYNTGSFTGSFTGSLLGTSSYAVNALTSSYAQNATTASYAATASNILGGTATYIPYFNTDTTLANSAMYQVGSASIAINETNITTANPEALYVFQTHPTSFNAITGKGNLNNYLQLNIQNTNQGISASSDVVATANNGNEESMYINMGINSENFNGPLGGPNDAYLYSIANNLHIGSAATGSQHLGFFVGGDDVNENNKITLKSNNLHEVTGSLDVSGSLVVRHGITGSLLGTASYATLAEYALNAGLLDNYDSTAFLLTSSYNNFTASYLVASASFSSSISLLSGSYLASSASFDTRILANSSSISTLSGSYLASSASFDSRILSNSSSISLLSGSYLASSASFNTRILANSSSIGTLSGSYLASSASFDTRIIANSSSIGLLSSSFVAFSGSYNTGSFSGSFAGDGSKLTNIPASGVVGLNLSQISSGSVTASVDPITGFKVNSNTTISGSTLITGSLTVTGSTNLYGGTGTVFSANVDTLVFTGSINSSGSTVLVGDLNVTNGITGSLFGTASYALNALNGLSSSYAQTASYADNFTVAGTLTAQKLVVQTITSSIVYSSGSNTFGNTLSDTQTFTGSVNITGSLNVNGSDYINTSASFDTRILANSSSIDLLSGSYLASSSSFDSRILANSSSIDLLSGSYLASSASFDTRILANSSSIDLLSGSYLASSASFDTRILSNSSSIELLSSSYLASSASFDTRILANSSSISSLSSSFVIFSGSYNTGSFTGSFIGSFTGSLFGTSSYALRALSSSYAETASYATQFNVATALTASGLRYPIADNGEESFIQTSGTGVLSLQYVKTIYEEIYNGEATSIIKGTPVYVSGSVGAASVVFRADAGNPAKMPVVYISADTIAPGATGRGIALGLIKGVDTTGYPAGTEIFVGVGGGWTSTRPTGSAIVQVLGYVTKEGNGGQGVVLNPGPNNLPNLNSGSVWVGDSTSLPVAIPTSSIQNVVSSSYAGFAETIASGLNITASNLYVTNNISASFISATSASFGSIQSVTGSAVIIGQEYIVLNTQTPAARYAGLQIYDSGSLYTASVVWDSERNHLVYQNASGSSYTGGGFMSGPRNTGSLGDETYPTLNRILRGQGGDHLYDSNISDNDTTVSIFINTDITGSLNVTNGITGSLFGTASWADNATTSSYALVTTSASYALNSTSASQANNANTAISASYALNSTSSSYALAATSASYAFNSTSASQADNANTATSSSYALNSTSASYAENATSSSYALNTTSASQADNANTATSASYSLNSTSASYALTATSASYSNTATSASYALNATTSSYALEATSASYAFNSTSASQADNANTATSASYSNNSTSASYALDATNAISAQTASFANTFIVSGDITGSNALFTGAITAQTLNVQTVSSSVVYSSGSNVFGNNLSNTQQFTGSVSITGSLEVNNSLVILTNQTSSMSVLSASYASNSSTASYALFAISASQADNAKDAISASYALNSTNALNAENSISSSYALNATSASYALNTTSASYAINSTSASYAQNATSASQADNANTATSASHALNADNAISSSYALNSTTASYALNSTSASYAENSTTASYALEATSASYALNSTNATQAINAETASFITGSGVVGIVSNANSSSYAENATSASYAFNSTSASYALTASYAMNGGGGGISAITIADGGVLQGTASYFDFIGAGVTATILNDTASIIIPGGSGGGAQTFSQLTPATTWSFDHYLNTRNPIVQVYGTDYKQVIPNDIVGVNTNTVEVRFDYSAVGYAIVSTGGNLEVTGSTSLLNQITPATTWSFAHNLNSKYINFEVYDSSDFVLIPAGIKVVDENNAEIYFSTNTTGKAVAQFSGINGSPNATSASYAATSSYSNNFTIGSTLNFSGTLTDYALVNSSVAGSNNLFTQATGSFNSAFFKYTVSNGGNARSGEVMAVWNGTTIEFTDNSTADIGTTNAVTASAAIVSGDIQFNVQTNSSGWKIKSIGTFI